MFYRNKKILYIFLAVRNRKNINLQKPVETLLRALFGRLCWLVLGCYCSLHVLNAIDESAADFSSPSSFTWYFSCWAFILFITAVVSRLSPQFLLAGLINWLVCWSAVSSTTAPPLSSPLLSSLLSSHSLQWNIVRSERCSPVWKLTSSAACLETIANVQTWLTLTSCCRLVSRHSPPKIRKSCLSSWQRSANFCL